MINGAEIAETIYGGRVHMSEIAENTLARELARKKKRKRNILIFCIVIPLNIALLVLIVSQLLTPASHSASDPLIGQPAPNFSLALLRPQNGASALALASLKGKPVVLNFWASWCDPCKEEAPLLENRWKQLRAQGKDVVFLGIDFQEAGSAASGFMQAYHITYPLVLDANGVAANKYRIVSLPDTIFINRDGTVVSKVAQQITAQALESNLQMIL